MTVSGNVWQLVRGEELVGEIVIEDGDFPWLSGRFVPTPAFTEFKPLFDEDLALMEAEEFGEKWEQVHHRITDALTLVAPDGPVAEFLLHIQADQAWFRWSDEPFDDD